MLTDSVALEMMQCPLPAGNYTLFSVCIDGVRRDREDLYAKIPVDIASVRA